MAYVLNGTDIRRPTELHEANSTQSAVNRMLSGEIAVQFFGSNKRVWVLSYENVKKSEYDIIKTIYDLYLSTGTTITWEVTESNYTIGQTRVHVSLPDRVFPIKGASYISGFELTLSEA